MGSGTTFRNQHFAPGLLSQASDVCLLWHACDVSCGSDKHLASTFSLLFYHSIFCACCKSVNFIFKMEIQIHYSKSSHHRYTSRAGTTDTTPNHKCYGSQQLFGSYSIPPRCLCWPTYSKFVINFKRTLFVCGCRDLDWTLGPFWLLLLPARADLLRLQTTCKLIWQICFRCVLFDRYAALPKLYPLARYL